MKKIVIFCSVLCGITALLLLVMGIRAISGRNYVIGLSVFYMMQRGTVTGFIGNILGVVISCAGFGALALCGFSGTQKAKKNGFIYGLIMTGLCLISFVITLSTGRINIGDIYMVALPAVYTFAVLKSA